MDLPDSLSVWVTTQWLKCLCVWQSTLTRIDKEHMIEPIQGLRRPMSEREAYRDFCEKMLARSLNLFPPNFVRDELY